MNDVEHTKKLLATLTADQRRELFEYLRVEFPIHAIETQLNARAEVILEAISRASDLTRRGIRGVIAEAAFETYVVAQLQGWTKLPLAGDFSYDFILQDTAGSVRVQVKMQRLKNHEPMLAQQAYRRLPPDMYVVETQRTRGGVHPTTGADTRPYSFGEFDILAVSILTMLDWTNVLIARIGELVYS